MKNKILLFGVMAVLGIASAPAFAAGEADLTTRGYVDGGLSFVYGAAKAQAAAVDQKVDAVDDKVDALENVVGTAADGQTPATGLVGDVASLQNVVGATASDGLRGDVATLQSDVTTLKTNVSNLQAASKTYTSGTGIIVTAGQGNNPSTVNLNLDNPTNGTNYVFQSNGAGGGSWTALPAITSSWDASAEARITGTQNEQAE